MFKSFLSLESQSGQTVSKFFSKFSDVIKCKEEHPEHLTSTSP